MEQCGVTHRSRSPRLSAVRIAAAFVVAIAAIALRLLPAAQLVADEHSAPAGGTFRVSELDYDAWRPYRRPPRPGARVLVLTHGVLETVESAFPAAAAARMRRLGGYDSVLGVSYDWAQPADRIAPAYGEFLRSLDGRRIDIEAHSYGAITTIAAVDEGHVRAHAIILLGAPLDGTPVAFDTPATRLALALPDAFWHGNIGRFKRMRVDGARAALLPHSDYLREILTPFARNVRRHNTRLVLIAGSDARGLVPLTNAYLRANALECAVCWEAGDGLVPLNSALGLTAALPAASVAERRIFDLRHDQLKTDPHVIDFLFARAHARPFGGAPV